MSGQSFDPAAKIAALAQAAKLSPTPDASGSPTPSTPEPSVSVSKERVDHKLQAITNASVVESTHALMKAQGADYADNKAPKSKIAGLTDNVEPGKSELEHLRHASKGTAFVLESLARAGHDVPITTTKDGLKTYGIAEDLTKSDKFQHVTDLRKLEAGDVIVVDYKNKTGSGGGFAKIVTDSKYSGDGASGKFEKLVLAGVDGKQGAIEKDSPNILASLKFDEKSGTWKGQWSGSNVGPIEVHVLRANPVPGAAVETSNVKSNGDARASVESRPVKEEPNSNAVKVNTDSKAASEAPRTEPTAVASGKEIAAGTDRGMPATAATMDGRQPFTGIDTQAIADARSVAAQLKPTTIADDLRNKLMNGQIPLGRIDFEAMASPNPSAPTASEYAEGVKGRMGLPSDVSVSINQKDGKVETREEGMLWWKEKSVSGNLEFASAGGEKLSLPFRMYLTSDRMLLGGAEVDKVTAPAMIGALTQAPDQKVDYVGTHANGETLVHTIPKNPNGQNIALNSRLFIYKDGSITELDKTPQGVPTVGTPPSYSTSAGLFEISANQAFWKGQQVPDRLVNPDGSV